MTSSDNLRNELQAIYSMHHETIATFEQGEVSIEESRSSFQEIFSAVNRVLRQTSCPGAFYFSGSPLVQETKMGLEYSSDRSNSQFGDSDMSNKDPLSPRQLSFGSDLPIHSQALKFPERATLNQLAFVSLYNLALSTHIAALELSSQPATPQKKKAVSVLTAAKLWELVYSFQWRQALNLKPIHALSILVNLGQAQYVLGNDEESRKCFENILSAIQLMEARNQPVPNRAFFLYSAFRMLGRSSAPSASAA